MTYPSATASVHGETLDELGRLGVEFSRVDPGTGLRHEIARTFEATFPMGEWAHVDWSRAVSFREEGSDGEPMFDRAVAMVRSEAERLPPDDLLVVVAFDKNDPDILLTARDMPAAAPLVLRNDPLWIADFERAWCFEWRHFWRIAAGRFA